MIQLDHKNFEFIFRKYYPELFKYCVQFVQKPTIAEELVQETFTRLWEKRRELSIEVSMKAYLYKAVKNRSIDFLRSKISSLNFDSEKTLNKLPDHNNPQTELEYAELEEIIEQALSSLPERSYTIFSMSRYGNYSNRQIAEILNISIKTVEYHITNSLKRLRTFVEAYMASIPEDHSSY